MMWRGYRIRAGWRRSGFTLIEVLVVLGIITVLVGIAFPVLRSVQRTARDVQCSNNVRQLTTALVAYAAQNRGSFPPNSSDIGQFWYLDLLIGKYLSAPNHVGRSGAVPAGADKSFGLAGGVFVCPNDLSDSVRSYSMNFYASGAVSAHAEQKLTGNHPPGRLFKHGMSKESSQLMLVLESWPELPVKGTTPTVYTAQAVVGLVGKPGARFGGGSGIVWTDPPDATKGRFDVRPSQITFYRHSRDCKSVIDPHGKAHFGFVDGHVALLRQDELVKSDGASTFQALWSPIDRDVEAANKGQ